MAGPTTVAVRIRFAWWLPWYVSGLVAVAKVMGCEPDMDKVTATLQRAIRVELVRTVAVEL